MGRRAATKRVSPAVPFSKRLVLNQWVLGLFGVKHLTELAKRLGDERLEGLDENNVHRFHHELCSLFDSDELPKARLLAYDQNIVAHTLRINEKRVLRREEPITWKYFQYLSLLFVEIYLDRYFTDAVGLRASINAAIAAYNDGKPEADQVAPHDEGGDARRQLNKISSWSATGSGKTLVMHVNLLQYKHYLARAGETRMLNKVLLLTPNEGLSRQHVDEFEKSGIQADLFQEDARGLFDDKAVEVIDIHKLREEKGESTFAIESFLGNNLVLVDEGHRGAAGGSGGKWLGRRDALCQAGFSFEYSATFGQAVKGSPELVDQYAKSILFDYSYRWFHRDGFGKEFQILNLDRATHEQHRDLYLTACVLAFYQQVRLFQEHEREFRAFHFERPLWIFVGGSVNAVRSENKEQVSDVVSVLLFLKQFIQDRAGTSARIRRVRTEGLVDAKGRDIFKGRFRYLDAAQDSDEAVFDDILRRVFNAPASGMLRVENLQGADGEIALRLGDNDPFGVINVGDDAKLLKLCGESGLATKDSEFQGSLFHALNEKESKVQLLIGSKKFTEGWSSWRVSTMGLMNVGSSEGSEIIQLFGRGVRLKGYDFSLKRSDRAMLPAGVKAPKHVDVLETLGIFGVRADYMEEFAKLLADEDIPALEDKLELVLPVLSSLGDKKLRTVRLKKEIDGVPTACDAAYRRLARVPTLRKPDVASSWLAKHPVVVDWYPRIAALRSVGDGGVPETSKQLAFLQDMHLAFVDFDRALNELERFKAERSWFNLNLSRDELRALLRDHSWYRLYISGSELALTKYSRTRMWQEIVHALLRGYAERFYKHQKREWEGPHLEYQDLAANDPNFLVRKEPEESGYRIFIDRSEEALVAQLEDVKSAIVKGELKSLEMSGLELIYFGQHLYQPLIFLQNSAIEVRPVALNEGERDFVEDLKRFHTQNPAWFEGKELYLLRNQSRGSGVGFFAEGNFYPDFLLWLLVKGTQHVVFVDPKGLRQVPRDDPKVQFSESVKGIERRLGDPHTHLHAFLISRTPSSELQLLWSVDKSEMLALNVLFQEEDRETYVRAMLDRILWNGQ